MGVLLLVRHGQASLGTADYDQLSDLGRRQAQVTGARLAAADLAVDRVVSGALTRQRDTAQAVLAALGRPGSELQIDERLDEYDHVGVMARHTAEITFQSATAGGADRPGAAIRAGGGDRPVDLRGDGLPGNPRRVHRPRSGRGPGADCRARRDHRGDLRRGHRRRLRRGRSGFPSSAGPALARLLVNASITKVISGQTGTHLVTFNDHAHLESDRALITYR